MRINSIHDGVSLKLQIAFVLLLLSAFQPAFAVTNYVFFSVNGDTTRTSLVQGDQLSWGANCDVGATLTWQIWLDLNLNSSIDSLYDKQIATFDIADGDTSSDGPPPDNSPIPDGWYISQPIIMGVAPAHYIFKAINHVDNSFAQRTMISTALPSPPNMFLGQVTIAGHPAPDSVYLRNIWIEASPDNNPQMWSGLTDENGLFQINVGDAGNGLQFRIRAADLPGYLTPGPQFRIASGVVDGIDFTYTMPTDSLYGDVRDRFGALITTTIYGSCSPRFSGPGSIDFTVANGVYRIFFGPSEYGLWNVGLNPDNLIPTYLCPNGFEFDNSLVHTQRHDFICYNTDTVMYARVTELGGNPTHHYLVMAQSNSLQGATYAISGTGDSNFVALHISSMDQNGWNVNISTWDDSYPIPPGYVLDQEDQYWNRHPGDTVSLNFIYGTMVRDTIKVDPDDPPPDWSTVFVNLFNDGATFNCTTDNNGVFTIYADTGTYMMNVNHDGYLASPTNRNLHLVADTSGGLGFVLNEAHCHVSGALLNVPIPIPGPLNIFAHTGDGNNGYSTWANVDSVTGTFELRLCDGNWTIEPPSIPNMISPPPQNLNISEWPDTSRNIDLVYNLLGVNGTDGSLPSSFTLNQNYPNPFNAQTIIEYGLPVTSHIIIEVFDLLGRKVATLENRQQQAGFYQVTWNAAAQPSGIYFYRVQAGDKVETKRMMLIK
jgi:hypothetical protein